jgi:hypothetical protein
MPKAVGSIRRKHVEAFIVDLDHRYRPATRLGLRAPTTSSCPSAKVEGSRPSATAKEPTDGVSIYQVTLR